ncbi:hypothetical protein [Agrococcus jejuensis]|uniref:Uncharacterized protein n=1 Tax=Agrococcus jejuensis TaxID=399736 RepID=A0A1G8ET22_9MICO|nr:hypothetical protein [Agrococcus jejuensis]SDH73042.1 hypothetical protein SAMN04489720_2179 [Agrococcus jejuensis]
MTLLEERMRALLRWYPRSWREQHGEVMLATLLDDAEARGLDEPARADAWSIRVHGVAAHASPTVAAVLAAATLAVVLVALGLARIDPFAGPSIPIPPGSQAFVPIPIVDLATPVLLLAVALPLVAWSLLALVGARRAVAASPLLLAAAGPAIVGVVLAVASIVATLYPTVTEHGDGSTSVSGLAPSWVTVPACLLVAACAVPLLGDLLPVGIAAWLRWPLAFVGACIAGAVTVGLAPSTLLALVAMALLLVAFAAMRADRVDAEPCASWSPQLVGTLGGVALCIGVPTTVFSIVANLGMVPVDGGAMRLVTALATAGSIAIVVAGAHMVRSVVGAWAWAPAAALLVAVLGACSAIVLGEARLAYAAVIAASAACAGAALAGTALLVLPRASWRLPAALATGIVAALLLSQAFAWLVPVTWIAGVPLVVAALVRARRDARAIPEPAYG